MKLVCVKCGKLMKPEKNEVVAENKSLSIWFCDKWKCPNCGYEILAGFGSGPISEHWQNDFKKWQKEVEIIFA